MCYMCVIKSGLLNTVETPMCTEYCTEYKIPKYISNEL